MMSLKHIFELTPVPRNQWRLIGGWRVYRKTGATTGGGTFAPPRDFEEKQQ